MANFSIVATVLSMVLGLSVTRLLLGAVTVFRIRRSAAPDWVPLVWAVILFLTQLDFWWAVNSLPAIKQGFSFIEFIMLVLLTLSLFVSAALLLPSRAEDERDGLRLYFEQDGRYALLSMSVYWVLGFIVNVLMFQETPYALWGLLGVAMIVLSLCAFFFRSRAAYVSVTILFIPIVVLDFLVTLGA